MPEVTTQSSVCERFMEALAGRDFPALAGCFSEAAHFRALVPRGPREAHGAEDATRYFQSWFGSYDRIDVLAARTDLIGDRHHLTWRLRVHGDDQQRVVEQQAYATVRDEQILELDLLCSGFRTEESATPVADAVLDGGDAGCATLTPLVNARLRELRSGQVLELTTSEPGAEADITSWSRLSGNALLGGHDAGATKHFYIRKK